MNYNICYSIRTGSHAYGLNREDSDEDFIHVYIDPPETILSIAKNDNYSKVNSPAIENNKDHTYYELRFFLSLIASNNPTILETIFTNKNNIINIIPEFQIILDNREKFLSKKIFYTYGRYAMQQLKRIKDRNIWTKKPPHKYDITNDGQFIVYQEDKPENILLVDKATWNTVKKERSAYDLWLSKRNPKRLELEKTFGYDTKHAMHLFRLYQFGIYALKEHTIPVNVNNNPKLKELLVNVYNGKFSIEEIITISSQYEKELQETYEKSTLQQELDITLLNQYCKEIILSVWKRQNLI